jgi:hypothetical protein
LQESFNLIQKDKTGVNLNKPFLIIDIGGATTDIYFGADIVDENKNSQPILPTNRYVFTYLGVFTSKDSTMTSLSQHKKLSKFLKSLNDGDYLDDYVSIREGRFKEESKEFLAQACFFLALNDCSEGLPNNLRLNLQKIQTIVITGGGAQLGSERIYQKISLALEINHCKIILDGEYKIWTEGLLDLQIINEE